MSHNVKSFAVFVFACLFALVLTVQSLPAQDHVVSTSGLHQALVSSTVARNNNIHQVETFLSSKPVQKVVEKSGYNLKEVQQAVPSLSNQELAQLAKTTTKAQNDFAAGALTPSLWTLIVVGAVVVIIILALKA